MFLSVNTKRSWFDIKFGTFLHRSLNRWRVWQLGNLCLINFFIWYNLKINLIVYYYITLGYFTFLYMGFSAILVWMRNCRIKTGFGLNAAVLVVQVDPTRSLYHKATYPGSVRTTSIHWAKNTGDNKFIKLNWIPNRTHFEPRFMSTVWKTVELSRDKKAHFTMIVRIYWRFYDIFVSTAL